MTSQEQSKCQVSLQEWWMKSSPRKCLCHQEQEPRMEPGPSIGEKNRSRENLFLVYLEINAFSQPSKLSEKLQWMPSAAIYYQLFTAWSINNTSCIYKAFVLQHSPICIEPTQFENIYEIWPLFIKEEFHREKKRQNMNLLKYSASTCNCSIMLLLCDWSSTRYYNEIRSKCHTQKTIKQEPPK